MITRLILFDRIKLCPVVLHYIRATKNASVISLQIIILLKENSAQ